MTHPGEQLVFELAAAEPWSFDNFLGTCNAEAVLALRGAAAGSLADTGVLLWGAPGAGKSHLLHAAVAAAGAAQRPARAFGARDDLAQALRLAAAGAALIAVDEVDQLDAARQGQLFTLYNVLRASRGHLIAAAGRPPAMLPLREDVRTRLGWGLVYEVLPLHDDDKPAALLQYARSRGLPLPEDVVRYLLAHERRDMATLVGAIAALDRLSLAHKRPITLPLVRGWLQRDDAP